MPSRLPIQDIFAGLVTSIGTAIRYWFHYTLVAFAWLGVVPLTACKYVIQYTQAVQGSRKNIFSVGFQEVNLSTKSDHTLQKRQLLRVACTILQRLIYIPSSVTSACTKNRATLKCVKLPSEAFQNIKFTLFLVVMLKS